ncbi:MAG: hypothetical protein LBO62_05345 [Endomicrobium sp.]|jgi:opacity protein-like surface antigen|nr:hypothetical protein [Endomicrobium sp.]
MNKLFLSLTLVLVIAASGFAADAKKTSSSSQKASSSSKKSSSSVQKTASPAPKSVALNGGKFAVGYIHNSVSSLIATEDGVSALAARYDFSPTLNKLSVEGSFGFISGDAADFFSIGAKGIYDLKNYPSFDVYSFAGANYMSVDLEEGGSDSIFALTAGAGIEYFVLSNLSVSTELGLAVEFGDNHTVFGLFGSWLSNIGIRYYFDI